MRTCKKNNHRYGLSSRDIILKIGVVCFLHEHWLPPALGNPCTLLCLRDTSLKKRCLSEECYLLSTAEKPLNSVAYLMKISDKKRVELKFTNQHKLKTSKYGKHALSKEQSPPQKAPANCHFLQRGHSLCRERHKAECRLRWFDTKCCDDIAD